MSHLLEIRNLTVEFGPEGRAFAAVKGVDITLDRGELLGVVGESGSGKSVSMLALMGLVEAPGRVSADVLRFDGHDLLKLPPKERRRIVGRDMAMIFQDPMTSLNPSYTVGYQIIETLKVHQPGPKAQMRERALELLRRVEIPDHPQLVRELKMLERHLRPGGRTVVQPPRRRHDDYANAVCLALARAAGAGGLPADFSLKQHSVIAGRRPRDAEWAVITGRHSSPWGANDEW